MLLIKFHRWSLRKVKQLVQSYMANKRQSWITNPGTWFSGLYSVLYSLPRIIIWSHGVHICWIWWQGIVDINMHNFSLVAEVFFFFWLKMVRSGSFKSLLQGESSSIHAERFLGNASVVISPTCWLHMIWHVWISSLDPVGALAKQFMDFGWRINTYQYLHCAQISLFSNWWIKSV